MTRRATVVLLVALALAGLVLPAAAAADGTAPAVQTANNTTTTAPTTTTPTNNTTDDGDAEEWSPPGPFELTELRDGGTHPSNAPDSIRMFPGGTGAVALQYDPVSLTGAAETQFLEPDTTIKGNELQLYSTRFGSDLETAEYTVHTVYWKPSTKAVTTDEGTTTIDYAADQHVETDTVTLGPGYDRASVSLKPHYDEQWEATMWLTRDGDRVPGAQWRFNHHSIPTTAGMDIDGVADFLRAVGMFVFLPFAIIAPGEYLIARKARRAAEDVGPGKSALFWSGVLLLAVIFIAFGVYVEAVHLIYRFPWALGIALTVPLFPLFLQAGENNVERVLLVQDILTNVTDYQGPPDESPGVTPAKTDGGTSDTYEPGRRYVRTGVVHKARRNGREVLVQPNSLSAFLGRWFGDLATIPVDHVKTRTKSVDDSRWSGAYDEVWELDPDTDPNEAFRYTATSLTKAAPLWPDWDWDITVEESESRLDAFQNTLQPLANLGQAMYPWALGGGVAWIASKVGAAVLGAPTIVAGIALAVLALSSLRGTDAEASMVAAPTAYRTPHAIIAEKAKQLQESRSVEEVKEENRRLNAESKKVQEQDVGDRNETFTEELLDETLATGSPDDDTGNDPDPAENGSPSGGDDD